MSFSWQSVKRFQFPCDVLLAGHEAEGLPLYAARARYRGGVYPGKVRYGFRGANIAYQGLEVAVRSYEVLSGLGHWAAARNGEVPAGAVPCGEERDGTPLYLARARLGAGLHPGLLRPGAEGAEVPFGGVAISAREYEVFIGTAQWDESAACETLLFWDFENTMSQLTSSIAVGIPTDPKALSGFVAQAGGGPAEVWPTVGTVFLTRYLGASELYLWLVTTRPIYFEGLTFRHWHNHNPGFPTHPSYEIVLQIADHQGHQTITQPLPLSPDNSGQTDTLTVRRELAPGKYRFCWQPRGLKRRRNTDTEFFAIRDLALTGRVLGGPLH